MARRESYAVGVRVDASQTKRNGLDDENPEHSFSGRKGSDPCKFGRSEANGDELGQGCVVFIEDAKCSVACIRHGTSFIYDMAQQDREVEVALNEEHGIEYPAQRAGVFDFAMGHSYRLAMKVRGMTTGTGTLVRPTARGDMVDFAWACIPDSQRTVDDRSSSLNHCT